MTEFTKSQFDAFSEKDRMNRTLEGTAFWAFLQKPKYSEKYKSSTFTISLGLDAANQELAAKYGLEVHPADKYIDMPYVVIQRKLRDGKTIEETRPSVVDSMQQDVPDSVLIGNGSKVIVKFGTYWYDAVRTTLFKVQIRELVEFKPSDKGMVMDEGGYKATGTMGHCSTSSEFDAG